MWYNLSMKKLYICVTVILLMISALPSKGSSQPLAEKPVIRFADVGWDSVRFHNALAGLVAERIFNFEVKELSTTSVVAHEAIIKGEVDVEMEAWADNLTTYQEDVRQGKLIELGVNFADNQQGFYVPRYVIEGDAKRGLKPLAPDLVHVADLARYAHLFPDKEVPGRSAIYGGIPGWSVTEIMRKKVAYYGLDSQFNYVEPGTDAALNATITSAIDQGVPVVAYYWEPTWLMGQYDLVLLKDAPYDAALYQSGGCACPSVRVTICASRQFAAAQPEFCDFLRKYRTSSALTSQALAHMQTTGDDYRATALWFVRTHRDVVGRWLAEEQMDLLLGGNRVQKDWYRRLADFPAFITFDWNALDSVVREFASRHQGFLGIISGFLVFLVMGIERVLNFIPWFVLLLLVFAFAYRVQKSWRRGLAYAGLLLCVGCLGHWQLMNTTLAIVLASVMLSLLVGLPLGVLLSASDRADKMLRPVLDAMQTMPVFVYLIPALLFFGMGYAPAVIATVIYAVVPVIRMTSLGIRQVDREVVEAARAFGSTWLQTLVKVQIPQALPTIMAGINQTLMMAMSMVVTCSMIGARGLGHEVLVAVQRMEVGRGLAAGFCVVVLAVLLDRMTQSYHKKPKAGNDHE